MISIIPTLCTRKSRVQEDQRMRKDSMLLNSLLVVSECPDFVSLLSSFVTNAQDKDIEDSLSNIE